MIFIQPKETDAGLHFAAEKFCMTTMGQTQDVFHALANGLLRYAGQ